MGVAHAAKRRRLSPPGDGEAKSSRGTYNGAAEWDDEQDYERRPRKLDKKEKEPTRLPIKTSEGVKRVEEPEPEHDESDSFLGTDDDEDEDPQEVVDEDEEKEEEEKPKIPLKVQIIQAKEEIARIATYINEDPEEHISSFKTMAEMTDKGNHVTIQKLALAAQVAIYKDVIPGYRIRALGEEDMSSKVSKEVRKIRKFEQTLLGGYKNFVHKLLDLTKPPKKDQPQVDPGLRSVAISCACNLLLAVPHFNLRNELLKIIVNRLAKKQIDADFNKCRETLEDVLDRKSVV